MPITKLYKIRDWEKFYENNRSRSVKDLSWVPIRNRHDGENYSAIVSHKDGAIIFSAFILMVEVASRCQPRGSLLRADGKPHTSASLSLKTRAPQKWFDIALDFLESSTDWLDIQELALDCQQPDTQLSLSCASRARAGASVPFYSIPSVPSGEVKEGGQSKARGTIEEVVALCAELGLPKSDGEWFFFKCEGCGWKNSGKPILDWRATIRAWNKGGFFPSQKNGHAGALSVPDSILRQKELERVEREMEQIQKSYDGHVSWSRDDAEKFRTLKTRKEELIKALGMTV